MNLGTVSSLTPLASDLAKTRVAVLFHRLGPYHHARLNAAGQGLSVWGVETCATEDIYAWDKVEGAAAFTRVTLMERDGHNRHWRRELHRKMWRTLETARPQAVVIPGWASPDAFSALAWCMKRKVPAVIMSESTIWDEQRVFWKEWIKGFLVKACAAGLVGGTPHEDYLAWLGMPRKYIFSGYDVVDNDYFQRQSELVRRQAVELRKQHGLPEKYFLASARFIEKKNLFQLLRAYARYRILAGSSNVEPWSLVLLGDGELKPEIEKLIAELHLKDAVQLPGFKQYGELPVYFGLAQVFVHPSTTEQWGLVVNEAMASGLPVLVSRRCGCAMDLVMEGANGFTFDPDKMEDLAQLMTKMAAGDFPLARFGTESRRIVSAWGPDRFASGLQNAVAAALKNSPPPAGSPLVRLLLWYLCR